MMELTQRRNVTLSLAALALLATTRSAWATDQEDAKRIVDHARESLEAVVKSESLESLRSGLKTAKGVLIFPSVMRGGVIMGATGGTGVLLVRGDGGVWSEPAFYTLGGLSVGLLAGGESAQMVVLVTSQKAVDRLLSHSLKLGGDASVAMGTAGQGRSSNVRADFISYARTKGVYAGLSIDGSILDVRNTLNHAYFGQSVTASDILIKRSVTNAHSAALREALAQHSR